MVILTEDDIPGAALAGRNPSSLKNEELKFWLRCCGDSLKELLDEGTAYKAVSNMLAALLYFVILCYLLPEIRHIRFCFCKI